MAEAPSPTERELPWWEEGNLACRAGAGAPSPGQLQQGGSGSPRICWAVLPFTFNFQHPFSYRTVINSRQAELFVTPMLLHSVLSTWHAFSSLASC